MRFDVIVIDDSSTDSTAEIVRQEFPQFELIQNDYPLGWVVSLVQHQPRFRGHILAFLGSHCGAHKGWLTSIEKEIAGGSQVITGMGVHGRGRLLERFEAVTIHPHSLGEKDREVDFVWDDNFAISSALLAESLPQTTLDLSDGAGAALLSRRLKNMGVTIQYQPGAKIDHITHSILKIVKIWYREMAKDAIEMRMVDPSIPGAPLLRLFPFLAVIVTMGRFIQGSIRIIRERNSLCISSLELVFHIGLFSCLMPVYFCGLLHKLLANHRELDILH